MSVEVQHVSRFYGRQKALDDVTFKAERGEVLGLLGPNGAGKTTLMKIITCFIPQHSGKISVCGYDVEDQAEEVKRRLGYLPENNPLYVELYVKEYLMMVAGIHGLGRNSRRRVDEIIGLTGLEPEYKKKIRQLSKGYRQRVGLAQALIHDPEVLILDEPTGGLDPNQLAEIRELIRKVGKQKTVILSTHIMQEVEAVCDRLVVIHQGRIVADEAAAGISSLYQSAKRLRVTFDKKPNEQELKNLPCVVDVVEEKEYTYLVYTRGDDDARAHIFHFAVRHGMIILGMEAGKQSLEQVFHQLTR